MSTAKATGYLELDLTGFDKAVSTAKKALAGLAVAFGAFKTAQYFKDGIKDAITFGKEIQVASNKMGGFETGKLLIVQKALEKAGLGAEEARGAMSDFVDSGRDIASIFGGADNYARALKSSAEDYGSQAEVLTRSAKALQTVFNTLESIGSKMKTFFLAMTEQFVGPLQVALDYLNEIDLAGIGAAFGESIAKAGALLLGLFKNGEIFNAAKLGLIIAFQEGVNYLVGGLNFVKDNAIPRIQDALVLAFSKSTEILAKGMEFIFSGGGLLSLLKGFAGIGAIITVALMKGLNVYGRALQAVWTFAAQTAINAIPGLSKILGGEKKESFGEMFKNSKNLFSDGMINSVDESGKENRGDFGKKFGEFMEKNFPEADGDKGFKKGNVFSDTEGLKDQLSAIVGSAFETGSDMIKGAGKDNKPPAILNTLSGGGANVIADSLAKVGGGGGSLKVGMSLAERSALRTARATEQTAKATEALAQSNKDNKPTASRLGR